MSFALLTVVYMKKTRLCKAVLPAAPPLALTIVCQIIAASGRGHHFVKNRKGELFYRGSTALKEDTDNLVRHHCKRIFKKMGDAYVMYIAENNLSLPDPITIKQIE